MVRPDREELQGLGRHALNPDPSPLQWREEAADSTPLSRALGEGSGVRARDGDFDESLVAPIC